MAVLASKTNTVTHKSTDRHTKRKTFGRTVIEQSGKAAAVHTWMNQPKQPNTEGQRYAAMQKLR